VIPRFPCGTTTIPHCSCSFIIRTGIRSARRHLLLDRIRFAIHIVATSFAHSTAVIDDVVDKTGVTTDTSTAAAACSKNTQLLLDRCT
jgi:hypothetical protein